DAEPAVEAGAEASRESRSERAREARPEPEARLDHGEPSSSEALGMEPAGTSEHCHEGQGPSTEEQESSKHDRLLSFKTPAGPLRVRRTGTRVHLFDRG